MMNIDVLDNEIKNIKLSMESGINIINSNIANFQENVNQKFKSLEDRIDKIDKKTDSISDKTDINDKEIVIIKAVQAARGSESKAQRDFGILLGLFIALLAVTVALIIHIYSK